MKKEQSVPKRRQIKYRPKERITFLVCFTSVLEADSRGLFQNITVFA